MSRRAWALVGGLGLGVAAGLLLAAGRRRRHRHDLFSARAGSRSAALGWLAAHGSPDGVRLLRDYVRWERDPALRRKGQKVLARLERMLAEAAA